MDEDLPYRVEYSKSSRAKCQACKGSIDKDVLRLAAMVQNPFHDGKIPKWYHSNCFFTKQRPKSTADIAHFDDIRWEDQQQLQKHVEESLTLPAPVSGRGKGKKRQAGAGGAFGDYTVEYAKSARAKCRGCEESIAKGEVRISKKDYESDDARTLGGLDRWHHVECFAKLRAELQFFENGAQLPGMKALTKEDQQMVKKNLPKIKEEDVPPPLKKVKSEPEDDKEQQQMKEQNQQMFAIRDNLATLGRTELVALLEKNKQKIPEGIPRMLDRISDVMVFGALKPCTKCSGQFVYRSGFGYKCTGNLTEWTKCEEVTLDPKRTKFVVPGHLREKYPFLKEYKYKEIERRVIKVTAPSTSSAVKKEDEVDAGPKVQGKPMPLKNMEFLIIGKTNKDKELLKKEIVIMGGKVVTKINKNLAAVISNPTEVEKMNKKMVEAKDLDIQVVSEDLVEEAKDFTSPAVMLINKKNICSWGSDPNLRIPQTAAKSASRGKSKFEKSASGTVKLRVKGGGAVDPESGLEDTAHIYENGKDKYTATLGITDIQSKRNSFYKIQLLKHDLKNKYWVFRSWGRIGTTIGSTKLESLSLEECIKLFERLYEEKSGNEWSRREHFFKVPNKMYPIDLDYGDDESTKKLMESDIDSKLKKPVQDLIKLIFDVDTMKKVMMEFEIDMDKMPLGKLSKKQIENAYSVLTELQELIKKGNRERARFVDASNRFYTLVPHNFGVSDPTILETEEQIKIKCEMLQSLLDLEIAFSLLNAKTDEAANPLDSHYSQLNADIDVLQRESEEFKLIEQYVKNTHAATHTMYDLEIEDVYTVRRHGEDKRYKPFKKLPNRKLLWHGSRITNFAGILSQGLRIAPPEAPSTGYMFGKGIYFADMVSKSANYCCTNRKNPTGLLMLCEVALGSMYERHQADYIEKLPSGKHSVLGLGQTHPDPEKHYKTKEGVEIPLGPGVPAKLQKTSSLLYNEYIVYDIAQVQVQYLLKMNFKYKI